MSSHDESLAERLLSLPAEVAERIIETDLTCAQVAPLARAGRRGAALAASALDVCARLNAEAMALRADLGNFIVLLFAALARRSDLQVFLYTDLLRSAEPIVQTSHADVIGGNGVAVWNGDKTGGTRVALDDGDVKRQLNPIAYAARQLLSESAVPALDATLKAVAETQAALPPAVALLMRVQPTYGTHVQGSLTAASLVYEEGAPSAAQLRLALAQSIVTTVADDQQAKAVLSAANLSSTAWLDDMTRRIAAWNAALSDKRTDRDPFWALHAPGRHLKVGVARRLLRLLGA